VVRVTIGDYLYRVPGFLENVNITVDNNYPWEVNLEKSQIGDIAQLPQVMDVSVSFKPIMDILPRRSSITRNTDLSGRLASVNSDQELFTQNNTSLIANSQNFIEQSIVEDANAYENNLAKKERQLERQNRQAENLSRNIPNTISPDILNTVRRNINTQREDTTIRSLFDQQTS
jgi:hypothetical protein